MASAVVRGDPPVAVRALGPDGFRPLVSAAATIYGVTMDRAPSVVASRREVFALHCTHPGMLAAVADGRAGTIGFGYGYLGAPGQWWHDTVARALGPQRHDEWLADCFEVAELHVLPAHQGHGIGGALLDSLLDRTGAATAVLSTPDRESRARLLYRSAGFLDLLTGFYFPGSAEPYAVMARHR